MPIQSSGIAELAEELKAFTAAHESKVSRLTDDMITLQTRYADDAKKRLDALEEKMNRGRPTLIEQTAAAAILESKELQNRPQQLARGQSVTVNLAVKNIISGISRTVAPYFAGVAPGPATTLRLRSVIPTVNITAGSVQYVRESSFVNAAAPVAEAAAKPQSTLVYTPVSAPVETIAHWLKIAKQTYEDLPQLAAAIESRLIYGLLAKEEDQLLNGTGISPNLQGFMPIAATAAAPPAGSTLVDAIAVAAGQLTAAGFTPTAAVVAAADWTASSLAKDTLKQYIVVPAGLLPPVVVSPAMAAGNFLVGDFNRSSLFVREDATLQVAAMNEDDFIKNLYTLLAELREVLCIYQAGAFLKGVTPAASLEFEL